MANFPDHAQLANLSLIEDFYHRYIDDPKSVDPSWVHFFEGIDFASYLCKRGGDSSSGSSRIAHLIGAYRRYGHLLAEINPIQPESRTASELQLETLGFVEADLNQLFPTLGLLSASQAPLKEILLRLQTIYCSKIGFEYMDLGNLEMEAWIQKRIESAPSIDFTSDEKRRILENLTRAEVFETFIHTKYVGQKRFSLEGNETLIPLLDELIVRGNELGIETFVFGMAHRGRLNVLANILQKPYHILFKEFDDAITYLPTEYGDVKYHKGYSCKSKGVDLHLTSNSSCLESVDGIVLGQTKAIQTMKKDALMNRTCAILMHGDAAMAGQGVFYEILQMGRVEGFSTGGTIQIAVNNQIGYTTTPSEGRSTRYCTDIAKTFGAPVFHVNAEDPESCLWVATLAIEIRQKFHCDVFIDLNGYRKYGHNETDEPGFTQPSQYAQIRSKPTIRQKYIEANGLQELAGSIESQFKEELNAALNLAKGTGPVDPKDRFGISWSEFKQPADETFFQPVKTAVNGQVLQQLASSFCKIPEGFHIHPKLEKILQQRLAMVQGDPEKSVIDWGMGECLALCSLIEDKVPVRLTGQDSCRGTFSHRHALWFDQETSKPYAPYAHLKPDQVRCDIYNTILSEFGSLAFEFGYTWSNPNAFVAWEAQYGDFVIGAETIIDHYITAAEQKWARYSSLTLLLPHGYEGAGPEHSSARMERFLQLAANTNIQVVNATTPAQYFHLLRRQALRPIKKPLIVFSPKSLLRSNECTSSLNDFTKGSFEEILDDPSPPKTVKRIILCSGKFYYELIQARAHFPNTAVVRLEQIYPLHREKLEKMFKKYAGATQLVWAQEEPENMGAAEFLVAQMTPLIPASLRFTIIARARTGSTTTGSPKQHKLEQQELLDRLRN